MAYTAPVSGKVKWFNHSRGFGFIVPANGGPDVFFHIRNVKYYDSPPVDGESCTYVLETNSRNQKVEGAHVVLTDRPAPDDGVPGYGRAA
jgi:CspA family cold shock protein